MKAFALAALFAACLAAPAWAEDEPTGPSFDCAKATTQGEETVCNAPDLGWYDRQLANAYGLAKKAVGTKGEDDLKKGQKTFIEIRDTCEGEDIYGCVLKAYQERLGELARLAASAGFDYGDYDGDNGSMSVARYPDKSVAMTISTIGGGDHSCAFETDRAKANGANITYAARYEGMEEECRIDVAAKGDALTVTSTSGCSYWCGVRAQLDGTFKKVAR